LATRRNKDINIDMRRYFLIPHIPRADSYRWSVGGASIIVKPAAVTDSLLYAVDERSQHAGLHQTCRWQIRPHRVVCAGRLSRITYLSTAPSKF